MGFFDKDGSYSILEKENLRSAAKTVYKNIFAFLDIIIGYALAVFAAASPIPKWLTLFLVFCTTVVILTLENISVTAIASLRYRRDIKIYDNTPGNT